MRPTAMCCSTCRRTTDYGELIAARPRGDARRRAGRGRALQARPGRFRPVEAERAGRDRLGFAVGQGAPRLAHRMLGDDPRRILARPSTSTAAGSTSSSRITRMRSPRAAARMAASRWRDIGCTTASSTWARRRCPSRSAISSRSASCWKQGIAARRCGWPCCRRITGSRWPWTEALIAQSKTLLDRLYRAAGDAETGEPDAGVIAALADDLNTPLALIAPGGDRRPGHPARPAAS